MLHSMRAVVIALLVVECAALVLPYQSICGRSRSRPLCASDVSVSVKPGAGNTGGAGPTDEQLAEFQAKQSEQLTKQVASMISEFPKTLMPGIAAPASLAKLEESYKANDVQAMFLGIYELTIEGECMYQANADGKLEPLQDIDWTDTKDETVQAKMKYLYTMGLRMLGSAGPETQEKIKKLVLDKLVSRVGLDGKAFDDWLL